MDKHNNYGNQLKALTKKRETIRSLATEMYVVLILAVFPLYLEDGYREIGTAKWKFYLYVTLPYLAVIFLCALAGLACARHKGAGRQRRISDRFVLLYGICVIVSWGLQGFRRELWTGEDGWYMGVAAQLLLVLTYFAVAGSRISRRLLLLGNAAGSGLCFLIGILQRLGWDILELYIGVGQARSDYLTTVGNRTWMSGYACAVFPLGLCLFWQSGWKEGQDGRIGRRVFWGLYSALAFLGLSASYSDSAYAALALVFFGLFMFSLGDGRKLWAFCQVLLVWFGSALLMCGIRALRGSKVRDARGLTCYVYEWKWMLAGLAVCGVIAVLTRLYFRHRQPAQERIRRRLRMGCLAGGVLACALVVGAVAVGSGGVINDRLPAALQRYLHFDDAWGDGRGSAWKLTLRMFRELPPWQKLFGVGADGFAEHAYGIPQYARQLAEDWGALRLTNAHNEWLNMFFCQGIVGGSAYLMIFVSALRTGKDGTDAGEDPGFGFALCAAAYLAHNFFCYQQICAAAPMFVLLGASGSLLRGEEENLSDDGEDETDYGKEDIELPQIYG